MTGQAAVRGVIFDMDGLMFDTERLHWRATLQTADAMGVQIDDGFLVASQGVNAEDMLRLLERACGSNEEARTFRAAKRERFEELAAAVGDVRKRGLAELLDALEERGIVSAVATGGGDAYCRGWLERMNVAGRFDAIVTGSMVAHAKPHPELFELAAARLGLDPSACMVLEDSPNGIRAACAAGCYAVMVPDMVAPPEDGPALPDLVLPSLRSVRALFACSADELERMERASCQLAAVARQEEVLRFDRFSHDDALQLGTKIATLARRSPRPIAVQVHLGDTLVFQYSMEGKEESHYRWAWRKHRTVMALGHSSLYGHIAAKELGDAFVDADPDVLTCAIGGFPLIVRGEVAGSVSVSGLVGTEDHELVVRALETMPGVRARCRQYASDLDVVRV